MSQYAYPMLNVNMLLLRWNSNVNKVVILFFIITTTVVFAIFFTYSFSVILKDALLMVIYGVFEYSLHVVELFLRFFLFFIGERLVVISVHRYRRRCINVLYKL